MVDILHVRQLCYMLISQIGVIYSTPGRNPISTARPIPARPIPSLSFRPICCLYVGLIKPNSAHCIIICGLPICLCTGPSLDRVQYRVTSMI